MLNVCGVPGANVTRRAVPFADAGVVHNAQINAGAHVGDGLGDPLGLGVGVGVAGEGVGFGVPQPLPVVPRIWNIWSGAAASMAHVAPLAAQLVHAGRAKPPPGLRHAAGELEVTVLSVQPHSPPVAKSILACTDTQ
jgi:hypothetical protein